MKDDDKRDIFKRDTAQRPKTMADNFYLDMFRVTMDFHATTSDSKIQILELKVWKDNNNVCNSSPIL